jgi:hypothetical protein
MKRLSLFAGILGLVAAACSSEADPEPTIGQQQQTLGAGALIDLSMQSKVGVLLDEIPENVRDRAAAALLAKPMSFWQERAHKQLQLATYRLVFRQYFYGGQKKQLPLPPEAARQIAIKGAAKRIKDGKHDTIVVEYQFNGTLLTDEGSPAISEPKLATVGGVWDEPFMFPLDPELLFQRTRYACMDEEDFPLGSVDSEETDSFYDQDCKDEKTLSRFGQCHATERPFRSCRDAVVDAVGAVDTTLRFTRRAWDQATADRVRISRMKPGVTGADLQVVESEFRQNRVVYKYIEPNACELKEERCVTGSGWRRLLEFATSDENVGTKTLDIGAVNYYLSGAKTLNDQYHIFDYSSCHGHYHFAHYGSFSLGDAATTSKKGFCLQSTDRTSNHELSPLHNPYGGCDYQGVEVGWVDQYKAGLPCQWVDITDIDTSGPTVTKPLSFGSNPDGFLCEGNPVLDSKGNPVFEPTAFKNAAGETEWRPKCEFSPNWNANNAHTYDVTLPKPGDGMITTPCARGQIGPLRNCGLANANTRIACNVGSQVTLRCSVAPSAAPQVVRVCDYSESLRTGIPCKYEESVKSGVVSAAGVDVTFACPGARGAAEPGGAISLYTGPVVEGDAASKVTCTKL